MMILTSIGDKLNIPRGDSLKAQLPCIRGINKCKSMDLEVAGKAAQSYAHYISNFGILDPKKG